jgi:hypothetical protein
MILRRFRLPVPARVDLDCGRPVRVTTLRRGLAGGRVLERAGPWRSSGGWWDRKWNIDDWEVALPDGVYRIVRDRDSNRWCLAGILD